MARPRTAQKVVVAYDLICPHCNESLPHPETGAFIWPVQEYRPVSVTCRCGQTVSIPKLRS